MTTFLKWGVIGAVVGLVVVGMNSALGQQRPKYATQPVDGLRYTSVYDQKQWPEMTFTVWIDNVDDHARNLDLPVKLVKQEFKGNMGARVVRPEDYVNTDLESATITGRIEANGTRMFTVRFKTRPETPANPASSRISYVLRIDNGPKPLVIGSARPLP